MDQKPGELISRAGGGGGGGGALNQDFTVCEHRHEPTSYTARRICCEDMMFGREADGTVTH